MTRLWFKRVISLQSIQISRFLKNLLGQLGNRHIVNHLTQVLDQRPKRFKGVAGPRSQIIVNAGILCSFQHRPPMFLGKCLQLIHTTCTDATLWFIDYPFKADWITLIHRQCQIWQNITNFLSIVELMSPHHRVRNIGLQESFFNDTRLGVGSVKDRKVVIVSVVRLHFALNLRNDKPWFVIFTLGTVIRNLIAFPILRPQLLLPSVHIIGNDFVGRIQNGLRWTIVLFQHYGLCVRIVMFKI